MAAVNQDSKFEGKDVPALSGRKDKLDSILEKKNPAMKRRSLTTQKGGEHQKEGPGFDGLMDRSTNSEAGRRQ